MPIRMILGGLQHGAGLCAVMFCSSTRPIYGVKAIPSMWFEPLELREVITEAAEDLYA